MHPIFLKRQWFAAYLVAWLFLALMLAGLLRTPGVLSWRDALAVTVPLCLFYAFVCLTPWYTCRKMPIGARAWANLVAHQRGAAILATAIWIELARLIAYLLDATPRVRPELPHLVLVALLLYSLSVALHYVIYAVAQSRRAQIQAREAELRAVKAQMNPHFLVSSLSSSTALVGTDPARAREMCIRLSDFLRKTLGLGER